MARRPYGSKWVEELHAEREAERDKAFEKALRNLRSAREALKVYASGTQAQQDKLSAVAEEITTHLREAGKPKLPPLHDPHDPDRLPADAY